MFKKTNLQTESLRMHEKKALLEQRNTKLTASDVLTSDVAW